MLGGTYAYRDYAQHKNNEFNGPDNKYDVRLVEDFNPSDASNWMVGDPITKEIRAANVGEAFKGYGPAYVRLQLKEYMEIGQLIYVKTDERYMVDTDGQFEIFESEELAREAYPDHVYAELTDAVTDREGWFVRTQEGDVNGQYGKHVVIQYEINMENAEKVLGPESPDRASDDAKSDAQHHEPNTGECAYTVHKWDGANAIAAYISWILGEDVVAYSEWAGSPALEAKWVYDDRPGEEGTGWVYWVQPLNPGTTTTNFLEKVDLIVQPEGPFYYAIHTDMNTVSFDELDKWTDMPPAIRDLFQNSRAKVILDMDESEISLLVGETKDAPDHTVQPDVDDQQVEWSSSDPSIVSVDPLTGEITAHKAGKAIITATAKNGARASYTVRVVDNSGGEDPEEPEEATPTPEPEDTEIKLNIGVTDFGRPTGELEDMQTFYKGFLMGDVFVEDSMSWGDNYYIGTEEVAAVLAGAEPQTVKEEHAYVFWQLKNLLSNADDYSEGNYPKLSIVGVGGDETVVGDCFSIVKDLNGNPSIKCTYLPVRADWIHYWETTGDYSGPLEISFSVKLISEDGGESQPFTLIAVYENCNVNV